MAKIRVESVIALGVGALLSVGCALVIRSALEYNARPTVRGVVGRINEGRDGQGNVYSKAEVEWTDAAGRAQTLNTTDPDRFAFRAGQVIELKVDPEDPTKATVSGVGGRIYFAAVFGGLGLYFFFVAVRGFRRSA